MRILEPSPVESTWLPDRTVTCGDAITSRPPEAITPACSVIVPETNSAAPTARFGVSMFSRWGPLTLNPPVTVRAAGVFTSIEPLTSMSPESFRSVPMSKVTS